MLETASIPSIHSDSVLKSRSYSLKKVSHHQVLRFLVLDTCPARNLDFQRRQSHFEQADLLLWIVEPRFYLSRCSYPDERQACGFDLCLPRQDKWVVWRYCPVCLVLSSLSSTRQSQNRRSVFFQSSTPNRTPCIKNKASRSTVLATQSRASVRVWLN